MNCRLAGLPDLNQSVTFVNQTLLNWTTWYVANYSFDGLRIDTVKHINHTWWKDLRKVSPWVQMGEVFDGQWSTLQSFTNVNEVQTCFNYPLYYAMGNSLG